MPPLLLLQVLAELVHNYEIKELEVFEKESRPVVTAAAGAVAAGADALGADAGIPVPMQAEAAAAAAAPSTAPAPISEAGPAAGLVPSGSAPAAGPSEADAAWKREATKHRPAFSALPASTVAALTRLLADKDVAGVDVSVRIKSILLGLVAIVPDFWPVVLAQLREGMVELGAQAVHGLAVSLFPR